MTTDPHVALFRRLALQLPGAVESAHMGHPDFRLNNRIFATLSAEEKGCGVLKLTREQQTAFVTEQPRIFSPVQGGWGRMGMTYIHLKHADESIMAGALQTAYRTLQQKQSQKSKLVPKQKKSAKSTEPAKTTHQTLQ
ncbi:MAG: MmcQ/YjbR family DNA-binding protein [Edaphobacter sp.]